MSNNHLIVGLGGTGGKIIRQIKKTIERNKDADGASVSDARFDFLYIDTSTDELDKRDEWKVLGKDIELDRGQVAINTASNIRPVLDDPGSFPGMQGWIEPRAIFDFVKPGIAGAAQRRKLGRMVFAQNAPKFVKAIEERVHDLQAQGKTGVTIHVVCGLAGGTGSGSVVDAVAQIRHQLPEHDKYRILIYAFLPEKNSKRVKDVAGFSNYYANGYAALAELNAMAVGKYHPINLLDGTPMAHDVYFNGCYLINNINEHGIQFEVESELPTIVAEFIYQKTLNKAWEGLHRAEKGENDIINFETEDETGQSPEKARAKLFLSFGIKRVVVPEQEIKEFLAYGFAEQASRQLMFNNFRQGEGYADEALEKDWGSEVRKAEVLQSLLLTDAHLMLETGILDDDVKNSNWKPPQEYWKQIVNRLAPEIKADKLIEETSWIDVLNTRLAKVFDDTYRTMGGVRKFYEVKGNARLDMARHIGRHIEKELFGRWKSGTASLLQLRHYTDALVLALDERQDVILERIAKMPTVLQGIQQRNTELSAQFNKVGFLGKHLTDKRGGLFADIATQHQDLYVARTTLEGLRFASTLLPFVKEQLLTLRSKIDELHQNLAVATDQFNREKAARLGAADAAYQKRIFDMGAITAILKAMVSDEVSQAARTQRVRQSLINLAGVEVESFEKLNRSISLGSIIGTLSQESARIVELAHGEIAKNLPPVLHVNIVERLQKQYDANKSGLKQFVQSLYDEAGSTLVFNKTEVDRKVGNASPGVYETVGVFLPACEHQKAFRADLESEFKSQRDSASSTTISVGQMPNQIVIMKVTALMPLRYTESLTYLKRHYDGLLGDHNESYLLHGQGNGKTLPPLFARTANETRERGMRKPTLLVANLLQMIKQRPNRQSGLQEWVFIAMEDGLPSSKVLAGASLQDVMETEHPIDLQKSIEKEVARKIEAEFQHIDQKNALFKQYTDLATQRFDAAGQDDQDPEFLALRALRDPVRVLIRMPQAS